MLKSFVMFLQALMCGEFGLFLFFFFTVVCLLTKESLSNTNGRGPLNDIWNENSFIISYKTQLWSGKDVPKNWLNVLWPELAERCIASFEDLPLSFFFFFLNANLFFKLSV